MAEDDPKGPAPSHDGIDERVQLGRGAGLGRRAGHGRVGDAHSGFTRRPRTLRKMIEKDPRLVNCSYQYRTPLRCAVQENQIAVVELLLDQGADATYASGNYWHAQPAIRRRDVDEVRALLTAEPHLVHAADRRGNMPIHWATMIRSLPMIDLILEKGGAINAMRPDGARALDLSNGDYYYRGARDVPPEALVSHEVLIGYLIAKGADYDIAVAAKVGDTERVDQLLAEDAGLANAVPPYSTYYSGLPLRNTCARGDVSTVRVLLTCLKAAPIPIRPSRASRPEAVPGSA